jgi:hypothetical protein
MCFLRGGWDALSELVSAIANNPGLSLGLEWGTSINCDDGKWVSRGFFLGWRFIVHFHWIKTPLFGGIRNTWFNG